MAAFEYEHQFTLPNGVTVCVRQLDTADAQSTQAVMTSGWEAAYVEPGLLTREVRRQFTDPDSDERVAFIAGRISEGRAKLQNGDMTGALYLGAFTVGDQARQVGMLKYSTASGPHASFSAKLGYPEGFVDEVDVMADSTHLGVGRALFLIALAHGIEAWHDVFSLAVVVRNPKARAFYQKHLAMREQGEIGASEGMPQSMSRLEMRGLIRKSISVLKGQNPWLEDSRQST